MYEVLKNCTASADAVIDADLNIFTPEANFDKLSAIKQLVMSFGTDEDPKL